MVFYLNNTNSHCVIWNYNKESLLEGKLIFYIILLYIFFRLINEKLILLEIV